MQRTEKGITIIELLTTFTILSVLAGIVFGVMGPSKEAARQRQCSTQLQQLYVGMVLYADDYGSYVGEGNMIPFVPIGYRRHLMPYVKNEAIFKCPDTPMETAYNWDTTYGTAMMGTTWQPELDHEQNRLNESVKKLGTAAWIFFCPVHDELIYMPKESGINEKYLKPFYIDLLLDGSVKAHRITDDRMRGKLVTK